MDFKAIAFGAVATCKKSDTALMNILQSAPVWGLNRIDGNPTWFDFNRLIWDGSLSASLTYKCWTSIDGYVVTVGVELYHSPRLNATIPASGVWLASTFCLETLKGWSLVNTRRQVNHHRHRHCHHHHHHHQLLQLSNQVTLFPTACLEAEAQHQQRSCSGT